MPPAFMRAPISSTIAQKSSFFYLSYLTRAFIASHRAFASALSADPAHFSGASINPNTAYHGRTRSLSQGTNSSPLLRIIQITDVYRLDNFPSLRTLIAEKRRDAECKGGKCISVLTGDFLAPYLLSSLDRGKGMISMLNKTPIDIVMFGNHEDDIKHECVLQRVNEYKGIWINTNMQEHDGFKAGRMVASHTITVGCGSDTRKIGFIGVLSDDPALYKSNAFGGAKIECPYKTMQIYKDKLEKEEKVDLVVPLCHLYEPQVSPDWICACQHAPDRIPPCF